MPKDTTSATDSAASGRSVWTSPRVTRLNVSEAELGPAIGGPDFERVS